MTEPVGCFIEYDQIAALAGCPDEGVVVRGTRYRVRPKDSGCVHASVDPKDIGRRTFVDVRCLDCGASWTQVAVTTCPIGKKPIRGAGR